MKALILNSGCGKRIKEYTENSHKCLLAIDQNSNIISRQIDQLIILNVKQIIITVGHNAALVKEFVNAYVRDLEVDIIYVFNEHYDCTNYIYSMYLARDYLKNSDFIVMHGDIVCETHILYGMLQKEFSSMVVSSSLPLPEKDFKAVIEKIKADNVESSVIRRIGIEFFENALAAQPVYYLKQEDMTAWINQIEKLCENNNEDFLQSYAENALNQILDHVFIQPYDAGDYLCREIDNSDDLRAVRNDLSRVNNRLAYLCFSTDIVHGGHISIINRAAMYGRVVVGVLTDEVVASYKRIPILPFSERKILFENLSSVYKVVEQTSLDYTDNLLKLKPDFVIHGDDWKTGFQKEVRNSVINTLSTYGGRLIEFPYCKNDCYHAVEQRARLDWANPDARRGRLKQMLKLKGFVKAMEAHDGLTGLVVENSVVYQKGECNQFDSIWVSSLCDSTSRGKPDIELVDMSSRYRTLDDLMEVTTKPIIFDGDTGGLKEHFGYTVRTLERMGVSMVIVEDKTGLKKNSLFGTEVSQMQDSIENFCEKIRVGKKSLKTNDFMICARIESLILECGMDDALNRADAIMIHSRKKEPDEIFEFVEKFRKSDISTFIVVVPTSYNSVHEREFMSRGVNIVIYANQLIRAEVPAIQEVANMILTNHRSLECDSKLMPFSEIIRMIPDEP